ncbi:putative GTP-binding protein 6 [Diorhabda sublineata]|uniref:putative GTP-binding protein 6 n=1 Tax=Diorhabda sublineata TaxID=1163346 RepID=UPI0024E0E940|nr:putative GTP-binding protein 6 [Diorhabda sublineata]XP_056646818.1 putative GTP-binding protein 6 [Diorhabda sublineata]XP_056646819.1 putative GTP-binding protein 6 [Diorhabda sublineata]XP_056646820.1 putative GTP-binding protein 6 [Diorhabda sublineata]
MLTIKFIRNVIKTIPRTFSTTLIRKTEEEFSEKYIEDVLESDNEYNEVVDNILHLKDIHSCLIIQPYVKWGPRKLTITPEEQLEEAVSLIQTLPSWKVVDTMKIPLESLDNKSLFKTGNMEKLSSIIVSNPEISAVFINASNLKRVTSDILQENFRIPILDRYKIVMQILKMHATSKYAKLQVALAELHFVRRKSQNDFFHTHDTEVLKLMFQNREQKIKKALQELRNQRMLLRSNRRKLDYPVIAVVGYTNAGKTCLIKALTGEKSLQPKNQLFATLDVTVHAGILPSGLEVLYVDTVGFLSDIPTNLIECFIATFEDAILADVILHVEDISSSCFEYKRNHVLTTLKDLAKKSGNKDIMNKIMSVGNKRDLVEVNISNSLPISAKLGTGLEELRFKLEETVLQATARNVMTIKVPSGGNEMRWLYKNSTVVTEIPDENNLQITKAKVIITDANLSKFKHYFLKNKRL